MSQSASRKHRFEYSVLRSLIFFINLLPVPVILYLSALLGGIAWIVYPFRLDVAYENLSTVFPQMERSDKMKLLRTTYLQFARTFGLVFILHRKHMLDLIASAETAGLDKLQTALNEGKGVILTTYHGCWFEAYFAWFNLSGLPTSLIYQKQSNPLSDAFFVQQRQRYGTSLKHLHSHAGMSAFREALEENRILIISLDQSYTHRGTDVTFFDRPLKCAKGSAMLHLRTGAPVLTSFYYMQEGKLHIDFDRVELPIYQDITEENIQDITTRSIHKYEPLIRRYPEQWFSLFHRLWTKTGYQQIRRSFGEVFLSFFP
jgi:Kdo2-lipid IVA lauroyltransferase/acyltransferase